MWDTGQPQGTILSSLVKRHIQTCPARSAQVTLGKAFTLERFPHPSSPPEPYRLLGRRDALSREQCSPLPSPESCPSSPNSYTFPASGPLPGSSPSASRHAQFSSLRGWILLPAPIFGRIPDAYRPRFLISTHFFTSESARPRCHPPNSPTGPLPVDGTALPVTVLCLCLRRPRALSPAPSIRHHCCTKDPDLRPQPLALPAVAPTSPPWVLEPSPGFPLSALSSSLSLLFEISESPESLLFPLPFLSLTSVPSFPSSPHWAPRWSF